MLYIEPYTRQKSVTKVATTSTNGRQPEWKTTGQSVFVGFFDDRPSRGKRRKNKSNHLRVHMLNYL